MIEEVDYTVLIGVGLVQIRQEFIAQNVVKLLDIVPGLWGYLPELGQTQNVVLGGSRGVAIEVLEIELDAMVGDSDYVRPQ